MLNNSKEFCLKLISKLLNNFQFFEPIAWKIWIAYTQNENKIQKILSALFLSFLYMHMYINGRM